MKDGPSIRERYKGVFSLFNLNPTPLSDYPLFSMADSSADDAASCTIRAGSETEKGMYPLIIVGNDDELGSCRGMYTIVSSLQLN